MGNLCSLPHEQAHLQLKGIIMSKTYKHQPTQPKQQKRDTQRYKREKAQPRRDWKSGLEWRLGKDD